ncbi:MAG: hypothetical protein IK083_02125 [Abditibacteriota bacterium]|nr:hypothetical protein [Abditibacteriota bacterium]
MRHVLQALLAVGLLALAAGAFCNTVKVAVPADPEAFARTTVGAPEYCEEYVTDTDIYTYLIREYADVTIVEKKVKMRMFTEDVRKVNTVSSDKQFLTGSADKTKWVSLETPGAGVCRDRIYSVTKDGDTVSVLALLTAWGSSPLLRDENIALDEIQSGKADGRTVILRTILTAPFFQSDNTGKVTQVPDSAEMIAPDVVRLSYADGAVEHWMLKPDRVFVANNRQGDRDPDRMLLWTNGVGKGTQRSLNHPAESCRFDPDVSREPSYDKPQGSPAPDKKARADAPGIWSALVAHINAFFAHIFRAA